MKEHTEFISRHFFAHFPTNQAKSHRKFPLADIITKYVPTVREQLVNILAATGIGALLLVSIALFLIQLAEYAG